jgi:hypothetical protein
LAREYVALAEKGPARPWFKAESSGLLGAALLGQGRFAEAESRLLAAFDDLQANFQRIPAHSGPRLCQSIGGWILQLYQTSGRSELVEEWRQRINALLEARSP